MSKKVPEVGGWRAPHGRTAELGKTTKVYEPCADGVRPVPKGSAVALESRIKNKFDSKTGAEAAHRRWALEKLPDMGAKAAPWLPPADPPEALR